MVSKIFFFKRKTAYGISACLVGSEMCMRACVWVCACVCVRVCARVRVRVCVCVCCLVYRMDAADDISCGDLVGSRIFKKYNAV